jgi:hypothetical protein
MTTCYTSINQSLIISNHMYVYVNVMCNRLKGLEAAKANILAARTVANVVRTSLGPLGNALAIQHCPAITP